jgi:predicted Na+-dependent transporter
MKQIFIQFAILAICLIVAHILSFTNEKLLDSGYSRGEVFIVALLLYIIVIKKDKK